MYISWTIGLAPPKNSERKILSDYLETGKEDFIQNYHNQGERLNSTLCFLKGEVR